MKKVLKFGGSSVAGARQIRLVVDIIKGQSQPCAVVVSALGGVTDLLKDLANAALEGKHDDQISKISERHQEVIKELLSGETQANAMEYCQKRINELGIICQGIYMLQELSDRSVARLMSFGELLSSYIVAEAMKTVEPHTLRLDARKLIITNEELLKAQVDMVVTKANIIGAFKEIQGIAIIPGFISATSTGVTSVLGRGGSDYTASIFAAALEVDLLEIWSDVSGMLTANPKAVPAAINIERLSYNEAFELSHFGAKVLYPPAIQPAYEKDIPVVLKNTFDPQHAGTRIDNQIQTKNTIVTGISSIDEVAMANLTGIGMVGVVGYSSRVFRALHRDNINVVMIAQSCSERGICIAVAKEDLHRTNEALNRAFEAEIESGRVDPIKLEDNLSIVALVGDGMKYRSGVSGRIFSVLGNYGINIRAIAQGSSESNVSIIIDSADEYRAIRVLHQSFFENKPKPIHLFIAGVGTVGSAFIELINRQSDYLSANKNCFIKIYGLANSRQMILSEDGIQLEEALKSLDNATLKSNLNEMYEFANNLKVPNKIFVDNTASYVTGPFYEKFLTAGMHVVTCNKVVASGPMVYYKKLKQLTSKQTVQFHYETNVGAALPMVRTIADMVHSGDTIHRIQAVLSGSLSFIYDAYDGSKAFVEVVNEAKELGYTEPNPMIDLGGVDVVRKIVILAREAGLHINTEDVTVAEDLPTAVIEAENLADIMKQLAAHEDYFKNKIDEAKASDKKLKYIAELKGHKIVVGLQAISSDHPFYGLKGTDNMVAIYSDRYALHPLTISGAGAGPLITASGVLADIISIPLHS
jgi:aspartokinase/homoserine dehydrogenase 1